MILVFTTNSMYQGAKGAQRAMVTLVKVLGLKVSFHEMTVSIRAYWSHKIPTS